MTYLDNYNLWLNSQYIDNVTKEELRKIVDNQEEIKDRFYTNLVFGTAGLRGKLGAGTNRMNSYVVGRATQGIANKIIKEGSAAVAKGVVIAYDVRIMSWEFCQVAARVFAANGIKTYVFKDIRPTPMLSYAVRYLNTQSGIVITASHNPQEYNGYKVYWEEGSQIVDDIADEILEEIEKLSMEDVSLIDFDKGLEVGLIEYLDNTIDEAFYRDTQNLTINEDINKDIPIVYTPLNGTGNIPVREVLKRRGFTNVHLVEEQVEPDGTFKTVGYPNPEDIKAFDYALKLAKDVHPEVIIATDPDCDRVAIMVKGEDSYIALNGNQTGVLLVHYILSQLNERNEMPKDGAIVKSIVTGDMTAAIAKRYGITTFETLTGFKNICALPNIWDKTGEYSFIFGYEESIGYVFGDHIRDKDGVGISMMIAEMTAYYSKQGKSLYSVLQSLYKEYGYYKEELISLVLEGVEGQERIARMMDDFRLKPYEEVAGLKVVEIRDFINGYSEISPSNVLKYILEDGSWFAVRPSGTEPKIKLYNYVLDIDEYRAKEKLGTIKNEVLKRLNAIN